MQNLPGVLLVAWTAMAVRAAILPLTPTASVDCGRDLGCFAMQAETCGPSSVIYTLDLDLAPVVGLEEGVVSSVTDARQVEPDPGGSDGCQFGLLVQNTGVSLSDAAVQAMLDRGTSSTRDWEPATCTGTYFSG